MSDNHFSLISTFATKHTITICMKRMEDGQEWYLTSVYGPQDNQEKLEFLQELRRVREQTGPKWLLVGISTLFIRQRTRITQDSIGDLWKRFRRMIDRLELKELKLNGRKYTWTNEQENPTMTRIDRVFYTLQWEDLFPTSHLQALVSMLSDHCPLYLQGSTEQFKYNGFRFELFWIHMPGLQQTVNAAWAKPVQIADAMRTLHILQRTAKALRLWNKANIGNIKLQIEIAKQVVQMLDVEQERHPLTMDEIEFRKRIKLKYQGLLAIDKIKAKQRSRITNIRCMDSNTKLFHLKANGRKRKKYIQALQTENGMAVSHEEKESVIHEHFHKLLGSVPHRSHTIYWEEMRYTPFELQDLDTGITEEEVKKVVMEMPKDKAPGPDGFIGIFFLELLEDDQSKPAPGFPSPLTVKR